MIGRSSKLIAAFCCTTMAVSAPASAAARSAAAPQYSPWAALSAFASQSSSSALCGAAASSAAAAQGNAPGCVLPQVDAPVAPPVEQAAPLGGVVAPVASSGFNIIPLLIGLGVIAGIAALVLGNSDDDDTVTTPPISPN